MANLAYRMMIGAGAAALMSLGTPNFDDEGNFTLGSEANAQSCGASAACPPPPPPPPPPVITPPSTGCGNGPCTPPPPPPEPPVVTPPVVTPPPGNPVTVTNPVTVNNNPVTQVGVSTSVATEVRTGDQNVTTGDVRTGDQNVTTGDQNVTVQGSTTTYRQVRQAPGAYAPTVIAPTAVGRCHETSGGPSGGISTPFGGISLGGRSRATINVQCEGHVQSIENRADARVAADSIDATDAWAACLARVDAMRANPIIREETIARAEQSCSQTMNAVAAQPVAVLAPVPPTPVEAAPSQEVGPAPAVRRTVRTTRRGDSPELNAQ